MIRDITKREIDFVRKIVSINKVSLDDQEDIVSEVMGIVCDEKTKDQQIDNFDGWLFVVTKHAIGKYYTEKKKKEGHLCNLEDYLEEYCANEGFFDWKNDIIDEELTRGYIWDKVSSLSGYGPQILKLYYEEGYRIREIAEILNLKENTVKTIKQRSLVQLREMILDEGGNNYEC